MYFLADLKQFSSFHLDFGIVSMLRIEPNDFVAFGSSLPVRPRHLSPFAKHISLFAGDRWTMDGGGSLAKYSNGVNIPR